MAVSPDEQYVLAGNSIGRAVLWSAQGTVLASMEGHAVRFSPDGRKMLLGCKDGVRVLDTTTQKELHRFRGHTDYVQGTAFSPDGRSILTGSWDGTLKLWQLPSDNQ